ncbi:beta strand repeat-containing protein [Patescibacteria group bacterium]
MAKKVKKHFFKILPLWVSIMMIFTLTIGVWQVLLVQDAQAAATGTFTALETVANVTAGTADQTNATVITQANVVSSTLPTPTFAGGVDQVASTVPTPTFAGGVNGVTNNMTIPTFTGGVDGVTNSVPTPTFSGGVDLVTSTVPAITFSGGVDGVAATATSTIPAALAATATDQSITIDGVVIALGASAQTAIQIATTIAGTDFSTGTSYVADGAYTVTNAGGSSATLTFTRTVANAAGNNGLTIADANYTTVNAVAATATSIIPAALAATATDQSITIDGVVIALGASAQTAIQIATTIAGTDFSTGTSYVADGAYTVTNVGGSSATLTFTRSATGAAGNNGLTIADANYTTTNEVKATRTLAVGAVPGAENITIGTCVVSFSSSADEFDCTDDAANIKNDNGGDSATTVAADVRSLTNVSDAAHGALTVGGSGTDATFTTTGAETSATSVTFTDGTGGDITSSVDTAGVVLVTSTVPAITFAGGVDLVTSTVPAITFAGGVDLVTSTVPAITFAGGVDLVTSTVPAITFAGGVDLVTSTVPAITFAGGVTAVAATATSTVPAALAATATDQTLNIDGLSLPLGNSSMTAIQIATAAVATDWSLGTSYVADGAYTVTNAGGTSATVTFTRTTPGTAGNSGLTVADANYTTVNGVAATATSTVPAALAASANDQTIDIDGISIALGASAQTAIQIATTVVATSFAGGTSYGADGAYTVTNAGGTSATLTFTRSATGTAGNSGLTVADANYSTVNGVAATATSVVPAALAAAANDQSITLDGVVIPLGNLPQTNIQIANTIAGTSFAGGTSYGADGAYTVNNSGSNTLVFTRTADGTAGNNGLIFSDRDYTTVNPVAATATSLIPAALAASSTDERISIDGVTINLGASALTAIQIAAAIAATDFSTGTSYLANGAYTVANGGTATATFTRIAVGTAGNVGLTVSDPTYHTVNAVAATASSTVPAGLVTAAGDQSITIDGIVIPLGAVAQTAIQIATTIAGTNFAGGTSYVADGAYTVANGGTATVTFTRTAVGTAGNNGLIVADASYGATAQINTITIGGTVDTDDTFTAALPGPVNATYTVLVTDTLTSELATGLDTAIKASAGYAGQAFTSAAVGSTVVLTAKVAGTGFTQTSSNTNRAAVAQVVTFTPALVTLNETYRGIINGTNYDHVVVGGDTVAVVVAAEAGLMTANVAVGCVNTGPGVTVTCTATVPGTAFTYSAGVIAVVTRSGGGGTSGDTNPPAAPTSINLEADSSGTVLITWTDSTSTDFSRIIIQRDHNPLVGTVVDSTYESVAKTLETFTETGLTLGETYLYRVRAKDTSGNLSTNLETYSITIPTEEGVVAEEEVIEAPVEVPVTELDLQDPEPAGPLPADVEVGQLVKRPDMDAVYFIDQDNRRHSFPNQATYLSWYPDFTDIQTISAETLAAIPLGSNVTMRPGTQLVKITSDPKVYAVEPYGVIKWVQTEAIANALYGSDWASQVVDVDVSFFINYQVGTAVSSAIHPTGSLMAYLSETAVYYIDSAIKRFVSSDVFINNLYQNKFVNRGIDPAIDYSVGADMEALPIETLMMLK